MLKCLLSFGPLKCQTIDAGTTPNTSTNASTNTNTFRNDPIFPLRQPLQIIYQSPDSSDSDVEYTPICLIFQLEIGVKIPSPPKTLERA